MKNLVRSGVREKAMVRRRATGLFRNLVDVASHLHLLRRDPRLDGCDVDRGPFGYDGAEVVLRKRRATLLERERDGLEAILAGRA